MNNLYWEMVWLMFAGFMEEQTHWLENDKKFPFVFVDRCMLLAVQQTNHFLRGHRGQELHDKCILLIDKYGYNYKNPDIIQASPPYEG